MNPDTNRFEQLLAAGAPVSKNDELSEAYARQLEQTATGTLLRPDGTTCPKHWAIFQVGEQVVIKGYTFEVKYIGETAILFEPVGHFVPVLSGEDPK